MRVLIIAIAALSAACSNVPAPETVAEAPATGVFGAAYPLSTGQRVTTSSTIYLGNLDARIEVLERNLQRSADANTQASLAGALLSRFRIVGRLTDGERALALANQAASGPPLPADVYRVQTAALSAFHQFPEAEAALAKAAEAGASAQTLAAVKRDLLVAQGRYAQLSADFLHANEPVADFYELAHRADLRLLQGDLDGASRWYRTAQDFYYDVDPMPLAWLYTQQGIALLRYGNYAQAKVFFSAAHERLPEFYVATEHLAECERHLGNLDAARKLYLTVIAQTGNPEFLGALAQLEEQAGDAKAAAEARAQAERDYRALLQAHRPAYAQHAAEFLLGIGKYEEALQLARENLSLRADVASLLLVVRAADAAGQGSEACAAMARVQATGLLPPELAALKTQSTACVAQDRVAG